MPEIAPWPAAGEMSAAVSALCWAIATTMFVRLRPPVPANALNLAKNLVGTTCFVGILWGTTGLPWPTDMPTNAVVLFLVSGVIGLSVSDSFLLRSMLVIGPQRASLIFCLAPVLVALGAMLPPLSEFPGALTWAGTVVCIGGIALAIGTPSSVVKTPADLKRGVRDAAIAAVLQAVAVLLAREAFRSTSDAVGGAALRMIAGTVGLLVFGLVTRQLGGWARLWVAGSNKRYLPAAALIGTFLGIAFNQLGIQWSEHAGVASTLNALTPVYLLPLSAWLLHERFSKRALFATALAIAGIALIAVG